MRKEARDDVEAVNYPIGHPLSLGQWRLRCECGCIMELIHHETWEIQAAFVSLADVGPILALAGECRCGANWRKQRRF